MKRIASILLGLLVVLGWPGESFAGQTASGQELVSTANPAAANKETPLLSEAEFREFLKTAKVVASKQTAKGITAPVKLTLSDGQRTIEACFQSVDISKPQAEFPGYVVLAFRDSYGFNIASYELAQLLGLEGMIPVTVEYRWNGQKGSLCLWVSSKWDEEERLKLNIQSPDLNAWNKQVNRMWVFSQLVYDPDRNQTNMLITEDWKLWMIDFTRSFRLEKDLEDPRRLVMCDRNLLEKLRQLKEAEIKENTKPYLSKNRIRALLARRDKIVRHFETLIAQKGESAVLY